MATFNDLIEDTLGVLRGYVRSQDQSTHLTAAVDGDDLVWSVADASRLSPGRAEVGSEIVYVDQLDETNNTVTIAPYGRGMDGSTASAHASLSQVINNPQWPRDRVRHAINSTLLGVSGQLFGLSTETFTTDQVPGYELPVDAVGVAGVRIESRPGEWDECRGFRFDGHASEVDYSTGRAVITGYLTTGKILEVTYRIDPGMLDADSDDFVEVTGLPASCADVITFGAAWRMLSAVGPGQLDAVAISAADLDSRRQSGEAVSESTQMYRMFMQRLKEERSKLLERFPTRVSYVGS